MRLKENERDLIEFIQNLDSKYPNLIVVVEGKRDERVLRDLGLRAPVIKTQTKLRRYGLARKIAETAGRDGQVLILTDFDRKGKEIHRLLEKELVHAGVKVLKRERRLVRRYMEDWTTIEQLVSLFKRRDSPEASR
jgi:5S rRNA maturation endonuclease (ribonuclease M5)